MNYKPTILYVEDEENIRVQLSKFLNYKSSELWTAEDGVVGLELFEKHAPDIIVSDIKMPNMNGIEMVKKIKSISPRQHIIFTTAHSESGFFMEAIESQVDGYILKPIDLDLLEEKIDTIIEYIQIKKDLKRQYAISNEIAQVQKGLLVVLDSKYNAIFANQHFTNYFHIDKVDLFFKVHRCLSDLFVEHEDFFHITNEDNSHWIQKMEGLTSDKRVVSIVNLDTLEAESFLVSITNVEGTGDIIITLTEVTYLSIEKQKFQKKAYTDALTKIPNRAYFDEVMLRYTVENTLYSIILFDIDKFKHFNDTYGHQTGDKVLEQLAKLIQEKVRVSDTFARWGGEEFVMILSDSNLINAKKVAETLRQRIEEHSFYDSLNVTCSFGVAELQENDTKASIMKKADDALYRAKENGRNRVEG